MDSKPLYALLRDEVPFKWTREHEKLFQNIKDKINEETNTAVPNPKYPFHIHVDSSSIGTDFLLVQVFRSGKRIVPFVCRVFRFASVLFFLKGCNSESFLTEKTQWVNLNRTYHDLVELKYSVHLGTVARLFLLTVDINEILWIVLYRSNLFRYAGDIVLMTSDYFAQKCLSNLQENINKVWLLGFNELNLCIQSKTLKILGTSRRSGNWN